MNKRQSNIELLRILSIVGVIILHYNNRSIGGGFLYAKEFSPNYFTLLIFESIAVCAVDLFFIISGYFLSNTNERNVLKVIKLFFEVIFFSELFYLLGSAMHNTITIRGVIAALIPNNYFVCLYSVIYIISPLINFMQQQISKCYFKRTMILLFIIFSIFPSIIDCMNQLTNVNWNGLSTIGTGGSQWGYTIVNFSLMYYIGGYIKTIDIKEIKTDKLIFTLVTVIVGILILSVVNENIAWSYCSPLVILEATMYMILFLKLDFGSRKVINELAKCCFTCFLTHKIFFRFIDIQRFATGNVALLIIHVIGSTIFIFLMSYILFFLYNAATLILWKNINKVKLVIKYKDLEKDTQCTERR